MASWSGMRKKLEEEYLAPSLRGRIQYFVTRYRGSHDQEGRAAIRFDGKEILQGCYFFHFLRSGRLPQDAETQRLWRNFTLADDNALQLGMFDQCSFYEAFYIYDNQSIEASLASDNLIVRIFAILDRRVGKRRLEAMKVTIAQAPETFQVFYAIRAQAEGVLKIPTPMGASAVGASVV